MPDLTHIGPDGRARMVDIADKENTERIAVATGTLKMGPAAFAAAMRRQSKKGDPIAIAELAGIMAAKRTADLIPLCHPLALKKIEVAFEPHPQDASMTVTAKVKTQGQTGVEMEALTAASVACLTLYDMLKAVDKSMVIEDVKLLEKSGGASGDFRRDEASGT